MASKLKTISFTTPIDKQSGILGELKVLQKLNEYEFGVELWLMRDGANDNKWDYQNISEHYLTFIGRPILIAYVNGKVGDGHNMRQKTGANGEIYQSFTDATSERIVGTLSDDANDFSLTERDGHTWVVAKGKLFSFYARETVEAIVRTGRMSVSVETLVSESHNDSESGTEVFTAWEGIGVTILGKGVAPAIPGASIAKLNALSEEFNFVKLKAASLETKSPEEVEQKGVRKMKNLSKRQMNKVTAKFAGCSVLAAVEIDEKIHVCMKNANGDYTKYVMDSIDEEIDAEKFTVLSVNAVMQLTETDTICMDVSDVIADDLARCSATEIRANEAEKALAAANEKIAVLEAEEKKRRVIDMKNLSIYVVEAFNANRENKVSTDLIAPVTADIEAGVYTNSVNADGVWCGKQLVEDAIYAICGKAVAKMDAEYAKLKKSASSQFSWSFRQNGAESHDDGTIKGFLASQGIETANI